MKLILTALIAIFGYFFVDYQTTDDTKKESAKKNEKYYQNIFCKKLSGRTEVVLDDKTRVDCLTDIYAIEVDWAKKWAQGIGQALYYGLKTKKRPAVALIVGHKDQRYIKRLETVAKKHNIKIFKIKR
ncbi:MAG: hypothetical protein B1H07_03365 [Campylobacteraceae bacterium 4484_166]|nr:MAG: hypothetical protein B1H07_03365 [Campylobacteraceae bacterium 4484_166]